MKIVKDKIIQPLLFETHFEPPYSPSCICPYCGGKMFATNHFPGVSACMECGCSLELKPQNLDTNQICPNCHQFLNNDNICPRCGYALGTDFS